MGETIDMTAWTLVTGGAQGLGAAICRILANREYALVIHYRDSADDAEQLAAYCRSLGVAAECCFGDFTTTAGVQTFLDHYRSRFPETQYLVNNVGNFKAGSPLLTPIDEWLDLFQVNVFATVAIVQGLISSIVAQQGAIVNIGLTGVGRYHADTYCGAYSAAKAALWQATRSLAKELAPQQVRVNMVSPGYMERSIDKPSCQQNLPMGREAKLSEVADAVAYLLSASSLYITGQNIEVAGAVRL